MVPDPAADPVARLEHDHRPAGGDDLARRGQPGEAGADDHDVRVAERLLAARPVLGAPRRRRAPPRPRPSRPCPRRTAAACDRRMPHEPGYSAAGRERSAFDTRSAELLGIELLEATPELVRAPPAPSRPSAAPLGGIIHGGAMMALADDGGGMCAFLNMPPGASGTATIESKTNFLRGVSEGALTATTRPLHVGRTTGGARDRDHARGRQAGREGHADSSSPLAHGFGAA